MLRAAISYEDRIHSSKRSRITLTGRNTLVRTIPKAQQAAMPALGDALEPVRLKRMCMAAHQGGVTKVSCMPAEDM